MLVNTSISSVLLLDKDEYSNLKLGIPLKRIKFKWRLSERISKRDLVERRVVFWETCGKYGVMPNMFTVYLLLGEFSSMGRTQNGMSRKLR